MSATNAPAPQATDSPQSPPGKPASPPDAKKAKDPKDASDPKNPKNPKDAPDPKDDLKTLPIAEVEKKLGSSPDGLSDAEAKKRLAVSAISPSCIQSTA